MTLFFGSPKKGKFLSLRDLFGQKFASGMFEVVHRHGMDPRTKNVTEMGRMYVYIKRKCTLAQKPSPVGFLSIKRDLFLLHRKNVVKRLTSGSERKKSHEDVDDDFWIQIEVWGKNIRWKRRRGKNINSACPGIHLFNNEGGREKTRFGRKGSKSD